MKKVYIALSYNDEKIMIELLKSIKPRVEPNYQDKIDYFIEFYTGRTNDFENLYCQTIDELNNK